MPNLLGRATNFFLHFASSIFYVTVCYRGLQCPVTGYPIPTITWYKNGVALNPDDPKYEFEADGQVLTVQ